MSRAERHAQRRTIAQHGQLRSPGVLSQILRFVGVAVATVLVAGIGIVGFTTATAVAEFAGNRVTLDNDLEIPPDIAAIEGGVDIFLAGVDVCEDDIRHLFGDRCDDDEIGDAILNDVNMLLHISDEPRKVTVISFPRDLMMPIPECTDPETGYVTEAAYAQPLNSAFGAGGLSCAVSAVEQLSGQDIEFAAYVTFGGVMRITDAIGGVEVCIANGMYDEHTGIDWEAGNRTLQGLDALQFLRTRHGVGDGSDLGRSSNQQQYMAKLARKLISEETLSNPATLWSLSNVALSNVTPSESLANPMTLVQVALAVKDVPFDDIVFVRYPVFDDPSNPNKVVPDYESADALWAALASGKSLQLTGEHTGSDGVLVAPSTEGDGATDEPADEGTATPAPSEQVVDPDAVQLPSAVTGISAADDVCSNGNVSTDGGW